MHVRARKLLSVKRREDKKFGTAYDRLKDAWDNTVVRKGDLAQPSSSAKPQPGRRIHRRSCMHGDHPNQWTTEGVLRVAFQSLGAFGAQRCGVGGSHNGLEALSGVSSAALSAQSMAWGKFVHEHCQGGSIVVNRHYDATPMRVEFGCPEMRNKLAPFARYFLPVTGDDGKITYRSVGLGEFCQAKTLKSETLRYRFSVDVLVFFPKGGKPVVKPTGQSFGGRSTDLQTTGLSV